MTVDQIQQIVDSADPHDGFRVKEVVLGEGPSADHSLWIVYNKDGVASNPPWFIGSNGNIGKKIWERRGMTDAAYGEKIRLKLVMEALCRFINTCGDVKQFEAAVDAFYVMHQGAEICFHIDDYHLIDTAVNTEGVYEHVFAADGQPLAVQWVEDQFYQTVPLSDLQKQQREAEEQQPYVEFFAGDNGEGGEGLAVQSETDPEQPPQVAGELEGPVS